ncbi:hypothetical predicted multi-pass transmembrane protein, unknown function [Cryptosporidium parvum]|uniref:Uncharacterized protein n=1 Tax=Cryptosporidium parvum TaxID=5807 RepID=A0A7G2HJX2_CRYPV|nr:hypothetical predicted multi-pass transmembrane protein, unknown function [Cryptosporidium parvum]
MILKTTIIIINTINILIFCNIHYLKYTNTKLNITMFENFFFYFFLILQINYISFLISILNYYYYYYLYSIYLHQKLLTIY